MATANHKGNQLTGLPRPCILEGAVRSWANHSVGPDLNAVVCILIQTREGDDKVRGVLESGGSVMVWFQWCIGDLVSCDDAIFVDGRKHDPCHSYRCG